MNTIGVVPTGVANLRAVEAAFERQGMTVHLLATAQEIDDAEWVVLPGVGSFESGMEALRAQGWDQVLRRRVMERRPTLAVCLGLQLLCEESEEAPGVRGLGCVPVTAGRLRSARVPHLGWNGVSPAPETAYLRAAEYYFANSYAVRNVPACWKPAWTWYGKQFAAAFEDGGVLACQFHPELSGRAGAALLNRWLRLAPEKARHWRQNRKHVDQNRAETVAC